MRDITSETDYRMTLTFLGGCPRTRITKLGGQETILVIGAPPCPSHPSHSSLCLYFLLSHFVFFRRLAGQPGLRFFTFVFSCSFIILFGRLAGQPGLLFLTLVFSFSFAFLFDPLAGQSGLCFFIFICVWFTFLFGRPASRPGLLFLHAVFV